MKVASMIETMTNGRLDRSAVPDMAFLSDWFAHPKNIGCMRSAQRGAMNG
jgi:hypothetical protein